MYYLVPSPLKVEQFEQGLNLLCGLQPTLHQYNNSTGQMELVEEEEEEEEGVGKVFCLLYPDKMLRCTMLGQYLPRGSQLSTSVM